MDSIGISTTHEFSFKKTIIFFYSLSNEPAFVLSEKKAEIPEALKFYNHKNYLNSKDFEEDIEMMIEKSALDTTYALEVLGKPSTKYGGEEDYSQYWIYTKYNLRLKFEFQNAVKFEVVHYLKIQEHGIALSGFEVTGTDYSSGFKIVVGNHKNKTIKYVWITVNAINPVGDLVATKTVRGIGPVTTGDFGTWTFDNVIYSKVVESLKITGIKIQYMDSSVKQIPGGDIKKLFIE